jgi:hypothetical protein
LCRNNNVLGLNFFPAFLNIVLSPFRESLDAKPSDARNIISIATVGIAYTSQPEDPDFPIRRHAERQIAEQKNCHSITKAAARGRPKWTRHYEDYCPESPTNMK